MATDPRLLLLAGGDNVLVVRRALEAGEMIEVGGRAVRVEGHLGLGHKLARAPIAAGAPVIKYGAPVGRATRSIAPGEHVHLHNLASDYTPTHGRAGE